MENNNLTGAIAALIDEYKKAVDELIDVIRPISQQQLLRTIEPKSTNSDCISIQTILTHVTASMFSYAVYIENAIGIKSVRPERLQFDQVAPYISRLHEAFNYNEDFLVETPTLQWKNLIRPKRSIPNGASSMM